MGSTKSTTVFKTITEGLLNLTLGIALMTSCVPQNDSGRRAPQTSTVDRGTQSPDATPQSRPDNGGIQPDWFKSGIYFSGKATIKNSQGSRPLTLSDLPQVSCFFSQGVEADGKQKKGLQWSFDNDSTQSQLQINLFTETLPAAGSGFEISHKDFPNNPSNVGYNENNNKLSFSSAASPGKCGLKIVYSKISPEVKTSTKAGKNMHNFSIAATIDCLLAGSDGETLQFSANAGCDNGMIFLPQ